MARKTPRAKGPLRRGCDGDVWLGSGPSMEDHWAKGDTFDDEVQFVRLKVSILTAIMLFSSGDLVFQRP